MYFVTAFDPNIDHEIQVYNYIFTQKLDSQYSVFCTHRERENEREREREIYIKGEKIYMEIKTERLNQIIIDFVISCILLLLS